MIDTPIKLENRLRELKVVKSLKVSYHLDVPLIVYTFEVKLIHRMRCVLSSRYKRKLKARITKEIEFILPDEIEYIIQI